MEYLYKHYNIYDNNLTWDQLSEKMTKDVSDMLGSVTHDENNKWVVVVGIKKIHDYAHPQSPPNINHETNTVVPKLTQSPG